MCNLYCPNCGIQMHGGSFGICICQEYDIILHGCGCVFEDYYAFKKRAASAGVNIERRWSELEKLTEEQRKEYRESIRKLANWKYAPMLWFAREAMPQMCYSCGRCVLDEFDNWRCTGKGAELVAKKNAYNTCAAYRPKTHPDNLPGFSKAEENGIPVWKYGGAKFKNGTPERFGLF